MAQRPFGAAGCLKRYRLAGCNPHLLGHQIDAENLFGDRMLDLDACVHLDEEPSPAVEIVDKFNGAGAFVFDVRMSAVAASAICARTRASRTGDGASSTSFWCRRWMLQSRSHKWIALPWLVAENLNFNVPHPREESLQVNLRIAERRQRLPPRLARIARRTHTDR